MSNADLLRRQRAATPRGVGVMCEFFADRATNSELWDIEGRRFIDFASGISVVNTGHRHPKVVAAISAQLERFTHTAYQVVPYASYVELAEKINQLTPGTHAKKTAFFTTGAEAIENAVKIARAATGRTAIISFAGAFHGRTYMGMALTGKVAPYKIGFGPFPQDVFHAPFPNHLHGVSVEDSMQALRELLTVDVDPKRVAAIFVEPVQGEGGFYIAPPEFMMALRTLCDEHRIILVVDEIQSGFARTGKLFALEHSGVLPDLLVLAKSLAGGVPLSAVCGRAEIMDAPGPGGLGGTYAGNPLAIASALAVLDIIDHENLIERANILGKTLKDRLCAIRMTVPQIVDVRGLGAMCAVEFGDGASGKPDAELAKQVQSLALANGLILLTCGMDGNVIRFLFPLTTPDAIMSEALDILDAAIRDAVSARLNTCSTDRLLSQPPRDHAEEL